MSWAEADDVAEGGLMTSANCADLGLDGCSVIRVSGVAEQVGCKLKEQSGLRNLEAFGRDLFVMTPLGPLGLSGFVTSA